jgi:D-serine deaminase-like pyridoxal phosphate-dependent protein
LPGKFEVAAVIISQVIDRGEKRGITLNLGHKRWGADQGPVELFSIKGAKVISFNEEHTVLETGSKNGFQIGDYILVVPRHVCSTVNLYEHFILVEDNGKILDMECHVDARNR